MSSYSNDLDLSAFPVIEKHQNDSIKALGDLIDILKSRIDAEKKFATSLEKCCTHSFNFSNSSLDNAVKALIQDFANESTQRKQFVIQTQTDVIDPLVQVKQLCKQMHSKFCNQAHSAHKLLISAQSRFAALETKHTKTLASLNDNQLELNRDRSLSDWSANRMSRKVHELTKQAASLSSQLASEHINLAQSQATYRDSMFSVMEGLEMNDVSRLQVISESLRKLAVFNVSMLANREYDSSPLVEFFEAVKPEEEISRVVSLASKSKDLDINLIPLSLGTNYLDSISELFEMVFKTGSCAKEVQVELNNSIAPFATTERSKIVLSAIRRGFHSVFHTVMLKKDSFDFFLHFIIEALEYFVSQLEPVPSTLICFYSSRIVLLDNENNSIFSELASSHAFTLVDGWWEQVLSHYAFIPPFEINDEVFVPMSPHLGKGLVKFIGEIDSHSGRWLGIQLYQSTGKHDGLGYFTTPQNQACLVRVTRARHVNNTAYSESIQKGEQRSLKYVLDELLHHGVYHRDVFQVIEFIISQKGWNFIDVSKAWEMFKQEHNHISTQIPPRTPKIQLKAKFDQTL